MLRLRFGSNTGTVSTSLRSATSQRSCSPDPIQNFFWIEKIMLCGIQGCNKPARHTGLCSIAIQKTKRRPKIPIIPYVDLKIGTMVNIWWDNYGTYFTGRVIKNNMKSCRTKIGYVDGDVQWHNMEFMSYIVLSVPEEKPILNTDNIVNAVQEMVTCSICMETMTEPVTTRCMHTFCKLCLTRALTSRKCCPLCNDESIKSMRDSVPDARFNRLVDLMLPKNEVPDDNEAAASYSLLRLACNSSACNSSASSSSVCVEAKLTITFNCRVCGGKKTAKAHSCGVSCVK